MGGSGETQGNADEEEERRILNLDLWGRHRQSETSENNAGVLEDVFAEDGYVASVPVPESGKVLKGRKHG